MSITQILGASFLTVALASMVACGPKEEAKTVTNSDTTTSNASGASTHTTTNDSQTKSSDGSTDTTHNVQTQQTPPSK
ncbi:hypothetical protein BH09MYX1_BH09MYX1_23680 [soil metagenome]